MLTRYRPVQPISSVLRIREEDYVELVGKSTSSIGSSYSFETIFRISNNQSVIQDYEKVVVTIRKKTPSTTLKTTNLLISPFVSTGVANTSVNSTVQQPISRNLSSNLGINLPPLRTSIENRAYSGIQIVSDSKKIDENILKKEVYLSFSSANAQYSVPSISQIPENSIQIQNLSLPLVALDVKSLLKNVNKELTDVTESVLDNFGIPDGLSSPVDSQYIDNFSQTNRGKIQKSLYSSMAKHFIDLTPRISNENNLSRFSRSSSVKKLDEFQFGSSFRLSDSLISEKLEIQFDLYKRGTNSPTETIVKNFDFQKHVDAFENIKFPPKVSSIFFNGFIFLSISDDPKNQNKVKKFAIYTKKINQNESVTPYRFVASVDKVGESTSYKIDADSPVTVVRVVPINSLNNESNVYTNIISGNSYDQFGSPSLTCQPSFRDLRHVLTIHNIPDNSTKIQFKKRKSSLEQYETIQSYDIFEKPDYFSYVDAGNTSSGFVEYSVSVFLDNGSIIGTNSVTLKNIGTDNQITPSNISVGIGNIKKELIDDEFFVSFNISTNVTPQENQRIINTFKDKPEYKEIYDQLINASNNASNAVNTDGKQASVYSDLYVHEIIRTDLLTGERSVFDLVTDGLFLDSPDSRSSLGINPINQYHEYLYQVITYVKDPLTILKNYIKKVRDDLGKEYFYLPYKWDNHLFSPTTPETDENGIPIAGIKDVFTSNPIGQTASFQINGLSEFASVTKVSGERIDKNTIKVSWEFDVFDYQKIYDSFVVLKTVNGTRSFVGRTKSNYIYHEINESDLGTIYYTVVPVTLEFDLDDVAHSEPFTIDTIGILQPTVVP